MTNHPIFSAADERAAFTAIHEARVAAWLAVLSDRNLAPRCLPPATPGLAEHVVWDAAREAAVMRPVRATLDAAAWYAEPLARRLAADDMTCENLFAARTNVGRLAARRSTPPSWVRQVGAAMARLAAAVDHVERHNLRLIVQRAARFARRCSALTLHDLVGYGALGLRMAVLRFDVARGLRFSTMATHWISHPIRRAIQDLKAEIRVPVHMQERMAKVAQARRALFNATGEDPSVERLAEVTGEANVAGVLEVLHMGAEVVSLEGPVWRTNDSPETLRDTLPDERTPGQDEVVHDEERRGLAARLLDVLDDRERFVVEARCGLLDGEEASYKDLAAVLGVTRQRVQQLQEAAMHRLRAAADRADEPSSQRPAQFVAPAHRPTFAPGVQVQLAL